MSRVLYCRLCAKPYDSVAGDQPAYCPECKEEAAWTTEPVPTVPYELNVNDRRFLRAIKIEAE